MNESAQNQQTRTLILFGLGLITLLLYLPSLRHEFLAYDDQQYVTENLQVQAGLTWRGLVWAFGYHAGNWHPLAWLSHMLDCQLYGLKPGGHHLTNILLHVATTLLLFLVFNRMTGAVWRSACVAALFAWHPLHVESVAWVAERKDVLCAFFWMVTLGTYARYVETGKAEKPRNQVRYWYGGTLICFSLALMSKPMAVTLPFALLLLDYWPLGRCAPLNFKRLVLEKIPFFLLSAIACCLTIGAQDQAIASTAGLPVLHRIAHAFVAYTHYLGAMIVPRRLAVFYPYDNILSTTEVVFAAVLLVFVTLLILLQAKRLPYQAFGWFWFLGTLVPVIGLVQVGEQAWADRYTYQPLVGLFVAVVWGATDLVRNRTALSVAGVTTGLLLLVLTSIQLTYWKNTRTLFEQASKVTGNNHMAITLLGSLLAKEGRYDEAIEQFRLALSFKPAYAEGHFFLGHVLDQQGKLDEAIAEYNRALRSKPLQEQTHIFLGAALDKQNKHDQAISHYLTALKLNPESAVAHNNLAKTLHIQGKLDEAIDHYFSALKFDPGLAQAHNNLGILLVQKNRLAEGTDQLRGALRLDPENPETQFNLGLALNQQEKWDKAAELFAKSVTGTSTDPTAHYQFGLALAHLRRTREAMGQFASALLLQPDFADALDGLSWILATDSNPSLRNGGESVRMAERACELTRQNDPVKLKTLAAAYAEAGRFPEAIATTKKAQASATGSHKELSAKCQLMLESFEKSEPWREL